MKCSSGHEMLSDRVVVVDPEGIAVVEEIGTCEECILVEPPWCGCGKCWLTPAELEEEFRKMAIEIKARGGP